MEHHGFAASSNTICSPKDLPLNRPLQTRYKTNKFPDLLHMGNSSKTASNKGLSNQAFASISTRQPLQPPTTVTYKCPIPNVLVETITTLINGDQIPTNCFATILIPPTNNQNRPIFQHTFQNENIHKQPDPPHDQ